MAGLEDREENDGQAEQQIKNILIERKQRLSRLIITAEALL